MNLVTALKAHGVTLLFFKAEDFACKCGCGQNEFDLQTAVRLDQTRYVLQFPLVVVSGYRCPKHNAEESHTGETGPHTTGHAVDLRVDRGQAFELIAIAKRQGWTGLGLKQHGASRIMHLDDLPAAPGQPRPTLWTYP